jgi:hypothetical protein
MRSNKMQDSKKAGIMKTNARNAGPRATQDRAAPGFAASRGEGDGSRLLRTLQGGRIRA